MVYTFGQKYIEIIKVRSLFGGKLLKTYIQEMSQYSNISTMNCYLKNGFYKIKDLKN